MKFVIIAAMDKEVEYLTKNIPLVNKRTLDARGYKYVVGDYDLERNIEVIIGVSGVGRVASGLLLANLNYAFNLTCDDYVVNVGTAGGIGKVSIGDVVVGLGCVYGDVDLSVFAKDYRYGQMSGCPLEYKGNDKLINLLKKSALNLKMGHICTNESFMIDYDKASKLISDHFPDFNILAFDMESAAYAQAAMIFKNNFLAIRYISDVIGVGDQGDIHDSNLESSSMVALKICLYLLDNL